MKFVKGLLIGGLVSAGAIVMYKGMNEKNRKSMMKKGRQFVKKLGII